MFNGADPDIIGPSIANSSTGTAFSPFTLPVTFLEFTLTATSTAILLQWATTEELQADRFEIETSLDGRTWSRLASVQAKGSFAGITKYAYTANRTSASLTYFRIKEVDTDGRFMYSSVRVCKQHGEASPALSIGSTHGKVVLRFSEEANEKVLVRIFNLNGQAISHHYLYNASGIVTLDLPGKVKGNFVISVENSTGRTAKQVFL